MFCLTVNVFGPCATHSHAVSGWLRFFFSFWTTGGTKATVAVTNLQYLIVQTKWGMLWEGEEWVDWLQTDKWAAVAPSPNSDYIQLQPIIVLPLFSQKCMLLHQLLALIFELFNCIASGPETDTNELARSHIFPSITEYWFLISLIYLYKMYFLDQMSCCDKNQNLNKPKH